METTVFFHSFMAIVCITVQTTMPTGVVSSYVYTFNTPTFFTLVFVFRCKDLAAAKMCNQPRVDALSMPNND